MSIRSSEFTRDKLLLLLNISWLFQLKKIDHNQLKKPVVRASIMAASNTSNDPESTKRGLVKALFYHSFKYKN